jgi:radical SAM protein with 4Fe4S-binding SPASM domain
MAAPKRYLRAGDQEARIPVSVVWELTLACDLACVHCGSRAGRPRSAELSTRECLQLVEALAELGARDVGLIGGEAYLRSDWTEIIAAIRLNGMECALQTGGRNLTEDRVRAAAAAGLQGAGVSLDGLRDVHDHLRGVVGAFDTAIAALAQLRRYSIVTSVNTQISVLSAPQLRTLMETVIEAGVANWQLALTVAMGRAADNHEILVQPYQLLELFPLLSSLHAEARDRGLVIQPANNIGYFGPYESQWRCSNNDLVHWGGCGAGDNVLGIEADGTIKACPGLPAAYAGGNVRDKPLAEIWRESQALAFSRTRSREDLWGYCRECYYADVCLGGCTWTTHSLFGKPGNNPLCHYRVLEMARRGLRERLVKVAEAPGLPFDHGRFEIVVEPATQPEAAKRRRLQTVP